MTYHLFLAFVSETCIETTMTRDSDFSDYKIKLGKFNEISLYLKAPIIINGPLVSPLTFEIASYD